MNKIYCLLIVIAIFIIITVGCGVNLGKPSINTGANTETTTTNTTTTATTTTITTTTTTIPEPPPVSNAVIVDKSNGPFYTIQDALDSSSVYAGITVLVKAGVYNEKVTFNKSGTAGNYITLQAEAGAIIDGTGLSVSGETGLINISRRSYIKIIGFEMCNLKTISQNATPAAIWINAGSSHIDITGNTIYDIETSEANDNYNAHAIACYGSSSVSSPNSDINITNNTISNCKLGYSETIVINGNVDGFSITGNNIHDNDNIGIDIIGYEGNGPSGSDYARNGTVSGNTVKNISSGNNGSYISTGEGKCAGGIYVDGGSNIVIERNKVDNCDLGIEVASEHTGKNTQNITIRNNFISRSFYTNISCGGSSSGNGGALNITIVNNTTYHGNDAEVGLQYKCNGIIIKNNIFVSLSGDAYLDNQGGSNTNVSVDNNIYFGSSTSSPGSWDDANEKYVNPNLVYTNPGTDIDIDMHIQSGSPAKNAGISNDASGNPISVGSLDIDGQARANGQIDIGADEL